MIVCRTLGPVQASLEDGSAPADLQWAKNLALLVYLARSPKGARSREHLIGLLWGDKPQDKARHSLNTALSLLRGYAGEKRVGSDGTQVSLRPGGVQLDTEQLEAFLAARDLAAAVALIKGEFLEGFSIKGASQFDDWMTSEREHWRRRSVEVLLWRADELLAGGDVAAALELGERALELDRESEAALRALMRGLALAGDRTGALKRFDTFATRLERELGTAPAPETRALAAQVRLERTWRLPKGGAAASTGVEPRRVPLVGRARELAQLVEVWTACRRDRRPALAVVDGDAGAGKTRLAEELVARARLDGAVIVALRAVEGDQREGWSGVLGLARGGLLAAPGVAAAPPAALAELKSGTPGEAPGRMFSLVLQAVADEQPVVIFVDDAQWLDQESLLALGAAARDLARSPLLVVCTATPRPPRVELDELRARIGRELKGLAIRVGAFSSDGVRALARWALPSFDDIQLDRLTRRVATDSAGIPLLVVALLEAVVAAIRVLFGKVSAPAQQVLAAAAILGGRVPASVLGRTSGVGEESLDGALDELEWARLLSSEPRGYSFVARIVCEVIDRDMVTAGQRQRVLEAAGRTA